MSALLACLALLAAACGGQGSEGSPTAAGSPTGGGQLSAQVASFDVATGTDQRLLVGLFAQSGQGPRPLVGGEVEFELAYLGQGESTATEVELGEPVTAGFLPVPGQGPDQQLDQPSPAEGGAVGVYEASVDLPEAGLYEVRATADVAGQGSMNATAAFSVAEEHQVPAVGDAVPTPDSLTVQAAGQVPPPAIDSRATNNDGQVPDPKLHDMTVREAVSSGRPTVIVISTPVYCQSQFCGPITETVEGLQQDYGEVANFIHLEVWRDFQNTRLNDAAKAFIQTEQGGNEPWTFLVGPDGTVQARWDNVLDAAELEEMLQQL